MTSRFSRLERVLLIAGIGLLAIYLAARVRGEVLSWVALWEFRDASAAGPTGSSLSAAEPGRAEQYGRTNFALWSAKRVSAFRAAAAAVMEAPLAVLSIPRLGLEVPVFEGTDELTLNRGAGWIAGTARPGKGGNVGIAGHRDGFFRVLMDVRVGDQIQLALRGSKAAYSVDSIEIVEPTDVRVLEPRERASLTLVTCYPFYFVGDAPQRYIVHAAIAGPGSAEGNSTVPNARE